MQAPTIPDTEAERLKALMHCNLLDTPAEERFDRITRLAKNHFHVPIVLISLVDSTRQWFKSRQGLDSQETSREISFCGHAILNSEIFYIPDAQQDQRFADNPLVTGAPHLRFYAGAPLRTETGERIGTLCLIDSTPRELKESDFHDLRDFADMVEAEINQTELLKATDELKNNEARIRAIVDTVLDGIITIDSQGFIQTFNPAAEKIFAYRANDVIGKNVSILMPEPYAREHDGYLHHYLATGENKIIGIGREVTGRRQDGSTFPMELSVSEMIVNKQRMFTGIVRDITERKRLEQLKSEFISTVSHELRTPLTSIRGAINLVLGKSSEQLKDKTIRMLQMAERNSERLTILINDILDLEKIESGSLDFEFSPVDLIQLTQRAIEENDGYASKHSVKLKLHTSQKYAMVYADQYRLLQVYANLISNAIKFSPPDGTVDIHIDSDDNIYRVSVTDHGSGIPDKFRKRIFQRFAQADSSDTREKGGTGLGLSISKAIIDRHHGLLDYFSEPGKGSSFYFELDRIEQNSAGKNRTKSFHRVLICEDDKDIALLLAEMLEAEGLQCAIANSKLMAMSMLNEQTYHLLLLDLMLPDGDGLALIDKLRTIPDLQDLPVIIVSAMAMEGKKSFNGDAVTVVDWLQKPIDRARLVKAMHTALANKKRPRILHIEDDPDIIQIVQLLLEDSAEFTYATSIKDAERLLAGHEYDLVILDLTLVDGSGTTLLNNIQRSCPVLIFSAHAPRHEIIQRVNAALTKSTTSNEELLATIRSLLKG